MAKAIRGGKQGHSIVYIEGAFTVPIAGNRVFHSIDPTFPSGEDSTRLYLFSLEAPWAPKYHSIGVVLADQTLN